MEILEQSAFCQSLKPFGIEERDDGQLAYIDDTAVLGFDFTNLTPGKSGDGSADYMQAGDRSVESAMVEAMLRIVERLDLFPVCLFSADDEWFDEDPAQMKEAGHITGKEANALLSIDEAGGMMDVLTLEADELGKAVSIITPQMTVFSNRCAITEPEGRFLATFSEDDEVGFNTTDEKIYEAARKIALEMRKSVPFEMIFAEDEIV